MLALQEVFFIETTKRSTMGIYFFWLAAHLKKNSLKYEKNWKKNFWNLDLWENKTILFKKRVLETQHVFFFDVDRKSAQSRLLQVNQSQNWKSNLWISKKVKTISRFKSKYSKLIFFLKKLLASARRSWFSWRYNQKMFQGDYFKLVWVRFEKIFIWSTQTNREANFRFST